MFGKCAVLHLTENHWLDRVNYLFCSSFSSALSPFIHDSFLSHWGQFKLLYDAEPVEQNGWVESIFTDDWGIATLSGPQQYKLVRRWKDW